MRKKIDLDRLRKLFYPYEIGPYHDEDFRGFYAKYKDLPVEVYSEKNDAQLISDLEGAKEEYFATALKENTAIPLPTVHTEETTEKTRFTLRVGKSLHKKLTDFAEKDSLSLNTAAILLLERGIAEKEKDYLQVKLEATLKELEQVKNHQKDLFNVINYSSSIPSAFIFEEKTDKYSN